jgi:hypothetical protein
MKLIFCLFFLIVSPLLFGDNILSLAFEMEGGFCPLSSFQLYNPPELVDSEIPLFFKLDGELILFHVFFIGGGMRSVFFNTSGYYMDTISIDYNFRVGFRIAEGIEIVFQHTCIHPALTYINPGALDYRSLEGAYETLSIRFKGMIDLF